MKNSLLCIGIISVFDAFFFPDTEKHIAPQSVFCVKFMNSCIEEQGDDYFQAIRIFNETLEKLRRRSADQQQP
jgi:hypothetical protein